MVPAEICPLSLKRERAATATANARCSLVKKYFGPRTSDAQRHRACLCPLRLLDGASAVSSRRSSIGCCHRRAGRERAPSSGDHVGRSHHPSGEASLHPEGSASPPPLPLTPSRTLLLMSPGNPCCGAFPSRRRRWRERSDSFPLSPPSWGTLSRLSRPAGGGGDVLQFYWVDGVVAASRPTFLSTLRLEGGTGFAWGGRAVPARWRDDARCRACPAGSPV